MPRQEPAQELHKVKLVLVRLPMDQLVVPEEGKKGEVRRRLAAVQQLRTGRC